MISAVFFNRSVLHKCTSLENPFLVFIMLFRVLMSFAERLIFHVDIIGDVVIVWRVRGKTIRSVLCNIVCNNCAQCNAHTYEQT